MTDNEATTPENDDAVDAAGTHEGGEEESADFVHPVDSGSGSKESPAESEKSGNYATTVDEGQSE